ncbi:hypothetical protein FQN60_010525 [Etheostoma spectabile]|uniref:Uncharacterized protein n=1 Tax=Etheostoma spectabile TaxID=54343 RepID=A0A5J5D8A5_9PERO|nr:hypothetical protein FQN60_010525 [Etheostoma spectabile]
MKIAIIDDWRATLVVKGTKILSCALLMGLIYALNLCYPKQLKCTFEAFQKLCLELNGQKPSSEVMTLKVKIGSRTPRMDKLNFHIVVFYIYINGLSQPPVIIIHHCQPIPCLNTVDSQINNSTPGPFTRSFSILSTKSSISSTESPASPNSSSISSINMTNGRLFLALEGVCCSPELSLTQRVAGEKHWHCQWLTVKVTEPFEPVGVDLMKLTVTEKVEELILHEEVFEEALEQRQ